MGKTYEKCTTDPDTHKPWCAIKVNSNGEMEGEDWDLCTSPNPECYENSGLNTRHLLSV